MVDEENKGTFDKLVAGLSSTERLSMLQDINSTASASVEFAESYEPADEKNVSLHLRYKNESFFYKFFLWLRGVFEQKSAEQVYSDDVLASVAQKIDRNHPGLVNQKQKVLDAVFYDRLKALKDSADFFKPYLNLIEDNPGDFYVFLSSFVTPALVEDVNKRADPFNLDFDVTATQDVKNSMLKNLDDVLKEMDSSVKNALYNAVSQVNWLSHFSKLPYLHFLAQFTSIVGDNYTCPYKNAAIDYDILASVFTNVRSVQNEVLEAMFLFSQRSKITENAQQKDIEHAVKDFLGKANQQFISIQMFISSVPVVNVGKLVNGNFDWLPQTMEGAEAWFASFRTQWRKIIELRWNDWIRAQKKNSLSTSLMTDFNISEFPVLKNQPWQNLWVRVPFSYDLTAGFLDWFVTNLFDKMIVPFNEVMLEGIFIKNERRIEYSEGLSTFSQAANQMKNLIKNLSADGEFGSEFSDIINNQVLTLQSQGRIDSLMTSIETEIREVISKTIKGGKTLEKILGEMLDDNDKRAHDVLQNLKTIKGHNNREWRENLVAQKDLFKKVLYYLVELDNIDSSNQVRL